MMCRVADWPVLWIVIKDIIQKLDWQLSRALNNYICREKVAPVVFVKGLQIIKFSDM